MKTTWLLGWVVLGALSPVRGATSEPDVSKLPVDTPKLPARLENMRPGQIRDAAAKGAACLVPVGTLESADDGSPLGGQVDQAEQTAIRMAIQQYRAGLHIAAHYGPGWGRAGKTRREPCRLEMISPPDDGQAGREVGPHEPRKDAVSFVSIDGQSPKSGPAGRISHRQRGWSRPALCVSIGSKPSLRAGESGRRP